MNNSSKQNADKPSADAQQDSLNAEEIGAASIYDDSTDAMRQMRRGNEAEGDPDTRDVAGTPDFKDTEEGRAEKDTVSHATTPGNKG
ncbi:MAG: hypothetical protein M3R15_09440 [Acidobacteriota bacterium]|nr:hypothetical protein [Acidobacteriota bacterium]